MIEWGPDAAAYGDILEECRLELDATKASVGHLQRKIDNLEAALNASRRVGVAVGIVMAHQRVGESEALRRLVVASQQQDVTLGDVARDVILTGALPA